MKDTRRSNGDRPPADGAPRRANLTLADLPLFADAARTAGRPLAAGYSEDLAATSAAVGADDGATDWALVRRLKLQSVDKSEQEIEAFTARTGRAPSNEDKRQLGRKVIHEVVAAHAGSAVARGELWSSKIEDRYHKAVYDSQFGFGRLQPLFEIPTAENITIHGCDSVRVQHGDGRLEWLGPVAESDEELMEQLQSIAAYSTPRRAFDAANLDMTLMIGDRFRLHAISNEISVRPRVAIRQHLLTRVSLTDLANSELMPAEVADFLDRAVLANLSIVVCGAQGAGKTTLLRALINSIPHTDAFATLETDLELFAHLMPGRDNDLALYSRSGMGEQTAGGSRSGAIGISQMVDMALRQALQRIIIGEIRGAEASAVFQAMQIGTGMMCTTHSKDAQTSAIRLASRVAEGGVYSVSEAMRQIGLCVDLMIHIDLVDDTWRGGRRRRYISEITACSPGDDGPAFSTVYAAEPDGSHGNLTPRADLLNRLERFRRPTPLERYTGVTQ